jgi:hypothetical protein
MIDLPQSDVDSEDKVDEVVEQDVQLGLHKSADALSAWFSSWLDAIASGSDVFIRR